MSVVDKKWMTEGGRRGQQRRVGNAFSMQALPWHAARSTAVEPLEARRLLAADLTAAFAGAIPEALLPGGRNRVAVALQNQGDAATSTPVAVSLYASDDTTLDATDGLLATGSRAGTIRAGGKPTSVKLTFPSPATLPDGDYYLIAQADSTGAVAENDETNNLAVTTSTVQIRQPFVDLTGTMLPVAPGPYAITPKIKPVKVTVLVRNDGNVAARGTMAVSLYVSTDETVDGADPQLSPLPPKALNLKPGKAKALKLKAVLPQNLTSGSEYHLLAQLDSATAIPESNENNNTVASPNHIVVNNTNTPPGPIAAVLVDGTTGVADGQTSPIVFATVAQGAAGSTHTFTVRNVGDAPLSLGAASLPPGFVIQKPLPTAVAPGAADTFVVALDTTAAGTYSGSVSFATNDPQRNPYDFAVSGVVTAAPGLGLVADTPAMLVGESRQENFTATLTGAPAGTQVEVIETDAAGTTDVGKVADLFDDGSSINRDAVAGDGVFNNLTAITFAAAGDRFFYAQTVGGALRSAVVKVSGVNPIDDARFQQVLDQHANVEQQMQADIDAGKSDAEVIEATRQRLLAQPDRVQQGSVVAGSQAIQWKSSEGILMTLDVENLRNPDLLAETGSSASPSAAAAATAAKTEVMPAADVTDENCRRAVVVSPFQYRFDTNGGAMNAAAVLPTAYNPWRVDYRVKSSPLDPDVEVDQFKGLGKYQAVLIASQYEQAPYDGTCIFVRKAATLADRLRYASDFIGNRLAISTSGYLSVTPRFIREYSGTFDESIVYLGGTAAARDSSLPDAFRHNGAKAVMAFTAYTPFATSSSRAVSAFQTLSGKVFNTLGEVPGIDEVAYPETGAVFKSFGDYETKLKQTCYALKDYDLFVQYSWNQSEKDLDTATLLDDGQIVGWSTANNSSYLNWSGDNTGRGGTETVTFDAYHLYADTGVLAHTVEFVRCRAGWYEPSNGSGPATLTVALRNKTTGEMKLATSMTISPGSQRGEATQGVAVIQADVSSGPDWEWEDILLSPGS